MLHIRTPPGADEEVAERDGKEGLRRGGAEGLSSVVESQKVKTVKTVKGGVGWL